ncbi:MAG: glutaminyl-peptide cyclotransferase [Solirubrobacteraceae bacterium]|nr:glutaminyl-peptide cyclotransferase [Solirubrobacteraceae bacterium]
MLIVGGLIAGAIALLTVDSGDAQSPAPTPKVNQFDGNRAWAELVREVNAGPRPAGSAALRTLAARLRTTLPNGRFEAVTGGLQNVVGVLPGRRPAIVLAAHYDTKDTPAGFVGANDGAGGTAVVLEAARVLRRSAPANPREIRFVLFDGEESPKGCDAFLTCGIRGSRAYAARHAKELKALVLADFVANRNLSLKRDQGSDVALWAQFRAAAKVAGVGAIVSSAEQGAVEDDHTPFMQAGVPAIDLIDFDFPQWHTLQDRPDVLSKRSLDAAGEAVVALMRTLRLH